MTAVQAYYRDTLTQPDRNSWILLAENSKGTNKVGDSVRLIAQNLFLRCNTIRLLCGLDILEPAPVPSSVEANPVSVIAGTTALGLQVTGLTPTPGVGDAYFYQTSRKCAAWNNYYKGPWPYISAANGVLAGPIQLVPAAGLTIGDRWFTRGRFVTADGRVSRPMFFVTDVLA